ncbi:MAG TPA: hypothetical protein VK153_00820 [Candidatus Paceibacterota bacterium]|nr:hypothetical protein [Candidatus Paceibacterota bacterium]
MEENKCCANGHCGKCVTWAVIAVIVLSAIAFYVGTLVGPLNILISGQSLGPKEEVQSSTGSITVNVLPPTTETTTTNNPPVLE